MKAMSAEEYRAFLERISQEIDALRSEGHSTFMPWPNGQSPFDDSAKP